MWLTSALGGKGVWVARVVVALTIVPAVSGLSAEPAAAHAELKSSDPANGDVVDAPPEQIILSFTEQVDLPGDAIQVLGISGDPVEVGPAQRSGSDVTVGLPQLEDGAYVVSWHVLSTDSHPIAGAFRFRVGEVVDEGEADAEALMQEVLAEGGGADRSLGIVYGVSRFSAFLGMVLLVGGALFVGGLWRHGANSPRARRIIGFGWLAVSLATIAGLGLQAAYAIGGSWADTVDPERIGDVVGTRFGQAWITRLGLLVVVLFAWRQLLPRLRSRSERSRSPAAPATDGAGAEPPHIVTIAILGLALLATVSFAGHAGSGDMVPFALVADIVHLTGVTFWLGGLALLSLVVLRHSSTLAPQVARDLSAAGASPPFVDEHEQPAGQGAPGVGQHDLPAGRIVRRFSSLAFVAVITIVVTGTFLGWRQSRSVEAVTDTTYGRLLLSKVALVAVVVAGAAVSRRMVRRWAERPDASVKVLRRSVGLEALVAMGVLAATAGLVNTVPAKDSLAAGAFEAEEHGRTVAVQVTIDPAEVGLVDLQVQALTHGGDPMELEEASLFLSLPERSINDLPVALEPEGPGRYVATGVDIPFAGTWELEVAARTSDISQERLTVDVPIQ